MNFIAPMIFFSSTDFCAGIANVWDPAQAAFLPNNAGNFTAQN